VAEIYAAQLTVEVLAERLASAEMVFTERQCWRVWRSFFSGILVVEN